MMVNHCLANFWEQAQVSFWSHLQKLWKKRLISTNDDIVLNGFYFVAYLCYRSMDLLTKVLTSLTISGLSVVLRKDRLNKN